MGVDPALVMAVIEVESGGDARAKSSKGAMGLMQLIPDTAKRFGVKNAWDPRQNVRGGVRYLQFLLSYFEGNVNYVLAAYNAGENAVDKYGGIPPFKETRRYIHKIRRLYTTGTLPFKQTAARRHSALVAKKETGHSGNTPTARLN
ncbi:MAG: lytic transglycosylase domain-containing protein [Hyphomicrobiales bacterium]|nr:lytic transglycosylase domain-containing protein [Hyphomicrobiales bacterium]